MAGIEDLMNIRTQGGTENAPPAGPPMGGPPMGGPMTAGGPPPMGPPPGMGGPPPMDPGMSGPPSIDPGMGEIAVASGPPPEEPIMNIEQDSIMLAEAVVGRAQGDIDAAIAVLDNAKAVLMGSVQDPMMANMGGPLYAAGGRELKPVPAGKKGAGLRALPEDVRENMGFMNMGGPLYRGNGGGMSDNDVMRQMIMENLQKPELQPAILENAMARLQGGGQEGRGMSDKDSAMETMMKFRSS